MVQNIRLPADVRKKQIRDAAKEIFLQKGFNNTSMEDVIFASGMSKGGVYRHYKTTAEMLYDLMIDGNYNRYNMVDDFISNHNYDSIEDIAIELSLQKILDKVEYKTLYAMFLMEAKENPLFKKLQQQILDDSRADFMKFIEQRGLTQLKCFMNSEWIAFMNSIILATELLDVRDVFLEHKDMFRDIIRQYMEKSNK